MTAIKNEKNLKNAISGFAAHDSRSLEKIFDVCRQDEKKMTLLIRAFCEAYLIDNICITAKTLLNVLLSKTGFRKSIA